MPVRHRALFVGIGLFVQIFACDALLVWVANRLCQQAHFSVDWRKGLLDSIPYSPLSATLFDADTGTQTADCLQISQGLNPNRDFGAPFYPNAVPAQESHPGVLLPLVRSYRGGTSPESISHSDGHAIFKVQ